ncbi:small subunit processome component 20 homolog isoform X1 [Selaginella moellendorffii]|uniref:small subunit processome component 20 homolog isoform X1 n=2 Tax=Selaginella moellendorffii TaxID=88036 RepID=UPI000D1C2F94|nr:small subunit processome component 20 homolog isoform X1 [Selaginella moellendorffii]XP_024539707.1 small subunit processome component 20 homolog isoform X1 [Selaginella moellendorffii]|eukprot:XP_024539706.1 small subunit processome component 20 homolog isoform X1 [Selaginella moellendorffii]
MAGRRKRSKSPEKRRNRFKFKSFAERIEDIDIDVFHSLDAVKAQPTAEGASFFYESLIQWRELNAAADFIELYGELLPLVQTLPQLLLHKATVINRLVSSLKASSLSLEPVFSLLAVLSRDLSEDFLQYVPEIFDGYYKLLQSGGDRDPVTLQGFTLVAYIFKYMSKYLSKDLAFVLKVTRCFRLYHQNYVRVFAAEAVSFVFRVAPLTQVIKGVRRLISETEKDPTDEKTFGCSALLTCTLKGPSSGFHSRAEELLKLLFSPAVICGVREGSKGDIVLEILKKTLTDLCEEIDPNKLELLWSCLLDEILSLLLLLEKESNWPDRSDARMEQLFLVLNHVSEYKKGRYMNGQWLFNSIGPRLLDLVPKLTGEAHEGLLSQALAVLLNAIVKKADENIKPDVAAVAWTSAFESASAKSLLPFIKGLLEQDVGTVKYFEHLILRVLEKHAEAHQACVLPLLLSLIQHWEFPSIKSEKLSAAVTGLVESSLEKLTSHHQTSEEAALVLTALRCFPYLATSSKPESFCLDFATAIDQAVKENEKPDAGTWKELLGAALLSYLKVLEAQKKLTVEEFLSFLNFGLKYLGYPDVLEAVSKCGLELRRLGTDVVKASVELNHQAFLKTCKLLEKNLWNPSKRIRMATLEILSVFEQSRESAQLLDDLLAIEATPLDIEHSRRLSSLILQVKLSLVGKPVELVRLAFHAVIGVLHNRFTPLWEPVISCVAEIMEARGDNVRGDFTSYLSAIQNQCLQDSNEPSNVPESQMPSNLVGLLLRIAQRTSSNFVSVSNEMISLFLVFLNHKNGEESHSLTKNDWKTILKEWLQLLVQLKNFTDLSNGVLLKQILEERFLVFNDADIQKKTLDCLLKWKGSCLTTYKDHLYKLMSVDTIRDELGSWSISKEDQQVANEHRTELMPVLVRILYPKLSKRNAKLGKSASHMRSSILTFLSCLEAKELETFFSLITRPLEAASSNVLLAVDQNEIKSPIDLVDKKRVAGLPHKTKVGFLHLVKDILQVFDGERIEPYLPALMGIVFRLLEAASLSTVEEGISADEKPVSSGKDLRTLCLKVVSLLLNNFSNVSLEPKYWELFFQATERSIALLKDENTGDKPTALLSCFLAMSTNEDYASLLTTNKLVVPNIFSILLVKNLSSPVHMAVLSFIQNSLGRKGKTVELSVLPHLTVLLQGLTQQLVKQSTSKDWKAKHLKEQLHIIFSVSPYINDPLRASEFLDTLLPFLKTKKPDPEVRLEVLKIVRELGHLFDPSCASKCVEALTPLLSSVACKTSRIILCESLEKLAAGEPSFALMAEILVDLNSMSTSRLDECDYERRQAGYEKLTREFLSQVDSRQALLLLSHLVFDLESEDMRYNASSCLVMFVKATGEGIFKDTIGHVVHEFLFSRITESIKSENAATRREWLIVFRELVILPEVPMFSEYRCLCSSDVEGDFFSNIIHIQLHRRIKAMAKFRAGCTDSQFSQRSLSKIFAPLFSHFLFESKDEGLVAATLETLGYIATQLQWSQAVNLVTDSFRLLRTKNEHQKVLVRLICLLLERTQFSQIGDEESKFLEDKVLPQLSKLMLTNESVNVPVSVVAIKVLKLLPEQAIRKHLPQLFQTITNFLKSRSQEIRDAARSSIVGMVEVLGAKYLQFTVKMLHSSLKRGYEKHVLGYTLNTILIRLIPTLRVGDIDYCLEDMLKILEEEVFGEVAAEKEVEALARKMKERKQARSYDSFRLIAQVMTFDTHIHRLLQSIREKTSSSLKVLAKVQLVLKNVTAGIQENSSATDPQVLVFVRELVEELFKPKPDVTTTGDDGNSLHILAEFALNLLHDRLRRIQPTPEEVSTLDSFVPLLAKCLSVKYTGVISESMRCLSILLKLPLSTITSAGGAIVSSVFSLAGSSSTTDSPLMQACMKLLSVILRHCKSVTLSKAQVHDLLRLNIFVEIEKQSAQCLSLLKAVVARKLVVPEIYDLMTRVQKLMITSQYPSTRQRCSEILLQFLLDYPLAAKRLQRHIDFLLGNLGYEHVTGREAALEMLHTIIVKFPDPVLMEQAESFFLTLITRLANDKDDNVQVLLQTVLRILMERVGAQMLEQMKGYLLSWMKSEKQGLWLPATQATGILVAVMDKNFERHLNDFWPAIITILEQSAEAHWKESFHILLLIEKVFQRFPSRLSQETWTTIQDFLLHGHVSVRTVSARLFGSYLENDDASLLNDLRWLFLFGAICCEQMASDVFDEELGGHVVKNLTTVAASLSVASLKLDDMQDERVTKALTMLRQKAGTMDQLSKTLTKNDPLTLFLRRLERVSFEGSQAKCVLTWYTSLVSRLGREASAAYLPNILSPLLKVERSTAPADLRAFAEGVREEIRELVGPESFATAYNQVSLDVMQRKDNRKRAKSIAALVDPEKTARKKIKLGQKRGAQKKRKRIDYRKT